MDGLIAAFPTHPLVLGVIALGAVVAALGVIWKMWIKPLIQWGKNGVLAAQEILVVLRALYAFFTEELPVLKGQIADLQHTLDEHIEDEAARYAELERNRAS